MAYQQYVDVSFSFKLDALLGSIVVDLRNDPITLNVSGAFPNSVDWRSATSARSLTYNSSQVSVALSGTKLTFSVIGDLGFTQDTLPREIGVSVRIYF